MLCLFLHWNFIYSVFFEPAIPMCPKTINYLCVFTQRLDYLALQCETYKVSILPTLELYSPPLSTQTNTHMLCDRPPKHSVCMPLEQLAVGWASCYNIDDEGHQPPLGGKQDLWDVHKHKTSLPPFFSFHSCLSLLCHSCPHIAAFAVLLTSQLHTQKEKKD